MGDASTGSSEGFSTVDALVGLTILSMSLALALNAQATARRVADRAREVRAATVLLQSLATRDLGQAQSASGVSGTLSWRISSLRTDDTGPVPLCTRHVEVRRSGTARSWGQDTLLPCPVGS